MPSFCTFLNCAEAKKANIQSYNDDRDDNNDAHTHKYNIYYTYAIYVCEYIYTHSIYLPFSFY